MLSYQGATNYTCLCLGLVSKQHYLSLSSLSFNLELFYHYR